MSVDKFVFRPEDKSYDFLKEGTPPGGWGAQENAEWLVPTHCPFCGVQCAMYLKVSGKKVVGVEPREDHPINEGRLCPKGVVAYQQVNHPDRLLYPMIRRDGKLRRASWEDAMRLVVHRFQEIQGKYGKDAIAVYGGSSLTTEKTYLIGKFARVALGTRNCDYNGRLCMTAAAAANFRAFGVDRIANPFSDMLLTDCIFLIGSNMGETFPVAIHWPWTARSRGAKFIVADPRATPTARSADLHLPLRPGTDSALLNAMLHVIIKNGLTDPEFIANRTKGFEKVKEVVERYPPERAAQICGLSENAIIQAAKMWGGAQNSMLFHARGVEHHIHGMENCLAAINIVLATGKIGKPGSGYGTLTGQGNGQGGREHGQKCDQLPGQRRIDEPEPRRYVAGVWGIPEEELPPAGASAVEMITLIEEGKLHGMLSICNNSMVSLPNLNWVGEMLRRLDFYVAIDFFMSETMSMAADVVLPGSVWAEDEGTTTNMEARVLKINKAVDPPGEARVDWQILCDLARRLGKGQFFPFQSPREIFDELRLASRGGNADYYGITYERLVAEKSVFWPCPSLDHPGTPRMFEDRFYHPDGKAIFHPIEFEPAAEVPDTQYPLYLTTGRVVYHYLSGNQTRRLGFLKSEAPEPWVEMHPHLAGSLRIQHGEHVRVRTRRGEVKLQALVVDTIRSDTIFIPYHWGPPVAANLLTVAALDPVAKIPEYKTCAAAVERI